MIVMKLMGSEKLADLILKRNQGWEQRRRLYIMIIQDKLY